MALAAIAGVAIGLIWLAWTGPGFVLAWSALIAGVLAWILRRRWLEVGVLVVATAAVPASAIGSSVRRRFRRRWCPM